MTLDVRTLYIAMGISCFLVAGALLFFQARRFVRDGVLEWIAGYLLQGVYWTLLGLRGVIPDVLSIIAANVLLTANYSLLFAAVRKFQHHDYRFRFLVLPPAATLIFFSCFFLYADSILIRTIYIALLSCVQMAAIAYVLFRDAPFETERSQWLTGFLFSFGALLWLTRLLDILVSHQQQNLVLGASPVRTILLVFGFAVVVLTSIGFLLMLHERAAEALRESQERFSLAFHSSPYAITITRASDGKLIEVNDAFFAITGYRRTDIVEKTTPELNIWVNEKDRLDVVDALFQGRSIAGIEFAFRRKSGEIMTGLFSAHTITINNEPCILSSISDITARKDAEEKIKSLLSEKDMLLREVHHRIKNNMTTIASLLSLQAGTQADPTAAAALKDARSRVVSMGAIYDRLYRSSDFRHVSARDYLTSLITEISATFPDTARVGTELRIDELSFDSKTLFPLGIIVNELITNAHKYAFPENRQGTVSVTLSRSTDGLAILTVRDDGVGIPGTADVDRPSGFGLSLVKDLAMQIGGTLRVKSGAGTEFRIEFRA